MVQMWKKMLLRKRRKKAKPKAMRSPLVVALVTAVVDAAEVVLGGGCGGD